MAERDIRFPKRDAKLLVKSFGLGVMCGELAPTPDLKDVTNGNKQNYEAELKRRIGALGLDLLLQETFMDPGNAVRMFFLLSEGFLPTMYERNQASEEDIKSMEFLAELNVNSLFARRVEMLKQAYADI